MLMGMLVALTCCIFIVFFAPNIQVMLVGAFFCAIPFGVFATSGPAYAAEVAPLALRGYLTAYVNLCWCIGQFISAGVLKGLVDNETEWGYRIPFAVQWIWPIPLFLAALFAPGVALVPRPTAAGWSRPRNRSSGCRRPSTASTTTPPSP